MPNLQGAISITGGQVQASQADGSQQYAPGTLAQDRAGRFYRYAQAGAAALVVGNVIQSAALIANHVNMTPVAAGVGATTVNVTPGATGGAANLYAGGLITMSTAGGGSPTDFAYSYIVSKHATITASVAFDVILAADDALQIAITTTTRVDIRHHPYRHVIQCPVTTLTGAVVGVAVYPIPATEWGWLGVWGPFPVLVAGTPGAGLRVGCPATVAGAVVVDDGIAVPSIVGTLLNTGVDTKAKICQVTIG